MKYYQLTKDLPTFKKGQIFYLNEFGFLVSNGEPPVVAYSASTLEKFPNILTDWFREVPEPERDSKTKYAFMEYISDHKNERFFQAIRNFAKEYLGDDFSFIYASKKPLENYLQHRDKFQDTFHYECDWIHELEFGEEKE